MDAFLSASDAAVQILKTVLLWIAVIFAAICALDWAVRTRKISPFQRHRSLLSLDRRSLYRADREKSSWSWRYSCVGSAVGARSGGRRRDSLLSFLDMVRTQVVLSMIAAQNGSAGIFHLLVSWTFWILRAALIVRVISSWLPISRFSGWVRWSYALSEPILAPLRRVVPNLGGLDITPILAYFLLTIVESLLFRLM